MTILHTGRLELRPWRADDVDFVFDLYSRWDVKRYLGREPRVMEDRSEAVALLERLMSFDDPVLGYWAVEEIADDVAIGTPVGTILLKSIPASGPAEPRLAETVRAHRHDARGSDGCVLQHDV